MIDKDTCFAAQMPDMLSWHIGMFEEEQQCSDGSAGVAVMLLACCISTTLFAHSFKLQRAGSF